MINTEVPEDRICSQEDRDLTLFVHWSEHLSQTVFEWFPEFWLEH